MKLGSTLFLRAILVLVGLAVLGLFGLVIPEESNFFTNVDAIFPFIVAIYASTIPFFFALFQTWKLLDYIDQNKAFSELSVTSLKYIKISALIDSAIYALCIPFMFQVAQSEDAPGVGAIGLILTFGPLGIAIFIAVLQRILDDALKLKSENDLTV